MGNLEKELAFNFSEDVSLRILESKLYFHVS